MAALRNMRQPDLFLFLKRDLALDLRVELKKAQKAAKVAKERESFELGVQETEIRLMEELAEVCSGLLPGSVDESTQLGRSPYYLRMEEGRECVFPSRYS